MGGICGKKKSIRKAEVYKDVVSLIIHLIIFFIRIPSQQLLQNSKNWKATLQIIQNQRRSLNQISKSRMKVGALVLKPTRRLTFWISRYDFKQSFKNTQSRKKRRKNPLKKISWKAVFSTKPRRIITTSIWQIQTNLNSKNQLPLINFPLWELQHILSTLKKSRKRDPPIPS